jgi:hypothetical protein
VVNQARLWAAGRRLPSAQREGRYRTADYCAGGGLLRRGFDRHADREPIAAANTTQRSISPKEDEAAKFTSVILATTEDTWAHF